MRISSELGDKFRGAGTHSLSSEIRQRLTDRLKGSGSEIRKQTSVQRLRDYSSWAIKNQRFYDQSGQDQFGG
jgi:hypothetical protein